MSCQDMCRPSVTNPADPFRGPCSMRVVMFWHPSRPVPGYWVLAALGAVCAALLVAAPAAAAPASSPRPASTPSMFTDLPGRRLVVDTPVERSVAPSAQVSQTLYLERCKLGCQVHQGPNDARTNTSTIPVAATSTVGEFANSLGLTGASADAEWAQVVQCMKEVYSPYNVVVTDVKPTSGASYHEALIAGLPGDIGQSSDVLGLAPLANDCSAIDDVISFTFANRHPPTGRVLNICWTAAQESAHAFGLDHEFSFSNNRSACNDPMTYRTDCGGEKFFRNEAASCGENTARPCKCGTSQNSHLKILSVFGAGTPITGAPTVLLASPKAGGGTLGKSVVATAGATRGVARVAVFFNGFKWAEAPGAAFQSNGQPNPSTYNILVPAALPDSIVDVKAVAYDDLGASTESAVVTVTKGAPCTTASTCAKGQKCEAGKCFWDPPSGELGDSCTYAQFCKSDLCTGTKDQLICTQACIPGVADACPSGFSCVMSSATEGVCFFASDGGGCCSVDRSDHGWWVHGGIAAALLGFVTRRRRRTTGAPRRP
jgi:hypothetical protein